jgi:DNA-binding response OmpR family regulator
MPSVLIVEDHQAVREGLVEAFTAWGYAVAAAGTMEEARFYLQERNFDLVVTDVDLGGENGLELVRFSGTSGLKTAFIVISGRFSPKEIFGQGFAVSGRLRYLQKPFLLSQLQAEVASLQEDGSAAAS